jgi:hypothetical protein
MQDGVIAGIVLLIVPIIFCILKFIGIIPRSVLSNYRFSCPRMSPAGMLVLPVPAF